MRRFAELCADPRQHQPRLGPRHHRLRDPNRLIRLRSAEAILKIKKGQAEIFHQVLAAKDKYALHAYLTALDNNGFQEMLREEITRHGGFSEATKSALLQALRIGNLHDDRSEKVKETALARAAGAP